MKLFTSSQRAFAETASELAHCNPFIARRTELERRALGTEFDERFAQWNVERDAAADQPNLVRLIDRVEAVFADVRRRGVDWREAEATDRIRFEAMVWFACYHRLRKPFARAAAESLKGVDVRRRLFEPVRAATIEYVGVEEHAASLVAAAPHMTAIFYQLSRAFHHVFDFILGASRPAVELRAAVWQSIFTHDMRRYRALLFDKLGDYATLITGPSGTGKELAARAIGLSQYIPFDAKSGKFVDGDERFWPLNLSALSPTLIESELFGHRRGAFTGAAEAREGWLERCSPYGTVFLDEIGELSPTIQVKLLRVLQERTFQRLGEAEPRRFRGKLISATNRDLAKQMRQGEFRDDLYYRLCSDIISTTSLRARLDDDPGELRRLVTPMVERLVGPGAAGVIDEVLATIDVRLGNRYAWPGNVRELEQCVRNVVIRRDYVPHHGATNGASGPQSLTDAVLAGSLTVEELVCRYCLLVYEQTGSYEATAERIQVDRRTVKSKIDKARANRTDASK